MSIGVKHVHDLVEFESLDDRIFLSES